MYSVWFAFTASWLATGVPSATDAAAEGAAALPCAHLIQPETPVAEPVAPFATTRHDVTPACLPSIVTAAELSTA